MKWLKLFVVAVMVATFSSAQVEAQETKFGRGRLLRKWRDDLIGNTQKKPDPKQQAQKAKQANAKQPTPAQRPASSANQNRSAQPRTTAPANRPATTLQSRTQSGRTTPSAAQNRSVGNQGYANSSRNTQPNRQVSSSNRSATPTQLPAQARTANSRRVGFGMKVEAVKDDQFIITQIDPRGNAAEAGLQRGDEVVEMGGIKLSHIEEFEGIVEVLTDGDQLQLKVVRRGSAKEVDLLFGQPEEAPPEEVSSSPTVETPGTSQPDRQPAGSGSGRRMTNDYDFVPRKSSSVRRPNSILEERAEFAHANGTQNRR